MSARVRHNPLESATVYQSTPQFGRVHQCLRFCTNICTKSRTLADSGRHWQNLVYSVGFWQTLTNSGGHQRMMAECVFFVSAGCQPFVRPGGHTRSVRISSPEFARCPLQFARVCWRTLAEFKSPPDSGELWRTNMDAKNTRRTQAD